MFDVSTFLLFAIASLVLIVTPGPAVLYIVARSIDQGRMTGVVSALGIAVGTVVQVFAATFGLSALLLSSALAFHLVKYVGALYLVYLGVSKLLEKEQRVDVCVAEKKTRSRAFYQGIIVNIFNPKTALFFIAFLPQFVDPTRGSVTLQMLALGIIFVVVGFFSDSLYAVLAGTMRNWLKQSVAFLRGQRYFAGCVYITLGIVTAFSGANEQ
jgi:threonine/homoserine/homoserine lactone efflux protein